LKPLGGSSCENSEQMLPKHHQLHRLPHLLRLLECQILTE
jgi:hypothetical protein